MRTYLPVMAFVAALLFGGNAATADTFSISYEAPGVQVQSATSAVTTNANTLGVENFDTRSSGGFTTDFGTSGKIQGAYSSGTDIRAALQYGGAGGGGLFASTASSTGYTLNLSTSGVPGVNYFGFWLSALDSGNQLEFYHGGTLVGTYAPHDMLAALGACLGANPYCGNPNGAFKGQDSNEPFAFVNFVDTTGYFDQIKFYESPGVGGYESDNHTVAYCSDPVACFSGTPLSSVPEPATLALLGLALLGLGYSRRQL